MYVSDRIECKRNGIIIFFSDVSEWLSAYHHLVDVRTTNKTCVYSIFISVSYNSIYTQTNGAIEKVRITNAIDFNVRGCLARTDNIFTISILKLKKYSFFVGYFCRYCVVKNGIQYNNRLLDSCALCVCVCLRSHTFTTKTHLSPCLQLDSRCAPYKHAKMPSQYAKSLI